MTRPVTRPGWRLGVEVAALAVVLVALAYCTWFRVSEGHWERVESPSMGTTAPVGTLLWVRPVDARDLEVGDFVTFHRPDLDTGEVFSHRVRAVHPDGTFETGGDLSGPDQWVVEPGDLVGRVTWVWPGVGRLVQAAPVLVIGGLVTAGAVALARRRGRLPLALLGASLTVAVAIVVYTPLTDAQQLGAEPLEDGGVRVTYVSTGILPLRVSADDAPSIDLGPGESGSVVATRVDDGRVTVDVQPAIPWWFWLSLVVGCFAPAVGTTVVGSRERVPAH